MEQKLILNISSHTCSNCGHHWVHSVPHIAAYNGSYIGSSLIRPNEFSNLKLIAAIHTTNKPEPFCYRCALQTPGIAKSWSELAIEPKKPQPKTPYSDKSLDDLLE